jgi:hypothetical protein
MGGSLEGLSSFVHAIPGWLLDRLVDFWALSAAVKVSFGQLILLAIAGWWAYHVYKLRRTSESTVRIEASARLTKRFLGETKLFIRVHVTNPSAVVVRKTEATLVLLDATPGTLRNAPTFRAFWKSDPLLLAVGESVNLPNGFVGFTPRLPQVEPNDCLESEVAYCTRRRLPDLMGLRISVQATQGEWRPQEYEWRTFAFLDPSMLGNKYISLSFHTPERAC